MARRVSLKGRGADIFFGDYTPPAGGSRTAEDEPLVDAGEARVPAVASEPVPEPIEATEPPDEGRPRRAGGRPRSPAQSTQGRMHASKHTSLQASKDAESSTTVSDSVQASLYASKHTSLLASTTTDDNDGQPGSARTGVQPGDRLGLQVDAAPLPIGEQGVVEERGAAAGASLAGLDGDVWARVDAAATITSSFRYTEAELTALTDVLYEVGKRYGARVTKQDVARLALNAVLEDYYQRGSRSLLAHLAIRRRRRTGG